MLVDGGKDILSITYLVILCKQTRRSRPSPSPVTCTSSTTEPRNCAHAKCGAATSLKRCAFSLASLSLHRHPIQVANVKLRPPEPSSSTSAYDTPQSTFWVQDTQVENPEAGALDLCPRPFKGVVICATGVSDKVRGTVS
jgi:hypothetical protein